MTKKLIVPLLIFIGILSILFSCKKSNPSPSSGNTITNSSACYITSFSQNGKTETTFTYDSQNRLVKTIDYDTGTAMVEDSSNTIYDSNNRLIKGTVYITSTSDVFYTNYYYNSDNILSSDSSYITSNNTTHLVGYDVYSYNSFKQITQVTTYKTISLSSTVDSSTTYTYDANGNVATTLIYNSNGVLQETITYTYDNSFFYFYGVSTDPTSPAGGCKNNILTASAVDGSGNEIKSDSYTTTYIYNSNNFPISSTTTYKDNTTETINYSYNCE